LCGSKKNFKENGMDRIAPLCYNVNAKGNTIKMYKLLIIFKEKNTKKQGD